MNTKVKITFIIIVTLVIGIVLGALINRALLRQRIQKAFLHRNPVGMVSFLEEVIEPTPEQRILIREILEKHRKKSEQLREKFMMDMKAEFESLEAELDPILTPEQKKRLKRRSFRPWRGPRRRPGSWGMPPPPGKPPEDKPPKEPIK
jgi:hypothetical protein